MPPEHKPHCAACKVADVNPVRVKLLFDFMLTRDAGFGGLLAVIEDLFAPPVTPRPPDR